MRVQQIRVNAEDQGDTADPRDTHTGWASVLGRGHPVHDAKDPVVAHGQRSVPQSCAGEARGHLDRRALRRCFGHHLHHHRQHAFRHRRLPRRCVLERVWRAVEEQHGLVVGAELLVQLYHARIDENVLRAGVAKYGAQRRVGQRYAQQHDGLDRGHGIAVQAEVHTVNGAVQREKIWLLKRMSTCNGVAYVKVDRLGW